MKKILSIILALMMCLTLFASLSAAASVEADEIPLTGMSVTASTSNGGLTAEKAIDGNIDTWWHSQITPMAKAPHEITINLSSVQTIYGFRYYPRPDSGAGICTQYEIHVSPNGSSFSKVAEGTWTYNKATKEVHFGKGIQAKAVKLIIVAGHGGYGSAAEIRLLNDKAKPASTTPTVTPSTENSFTKEDEVSIDGVYMEASSIAGIQTADLALDGKTATCWHTTISPKAEGPHTLTMTLPEKTTIYGYRYYPRPDKGAGICKQYELHVSTDGKTFSKVAEGTWAYSVDVKDIYFSKGIEVKSVRLVIIDGHGGYGSAAEVRLLNEKAKAPAGTATVTPDAKPATPATGSGNTKEDEISVAGVTVETSSVAGVQKGDLAIDGKTGTCWHTTINPFANGPHTLTMTLPEKTTIYGYRYYPRPDKGAGICTEYELHTSTDGKTYTKIAEGAWDYSVDPKDVYFGKGVEVLSVKLVIVTGHGGYGSAAEVRLLNDKVAGKASNITGKTLGAADELPTVNWKFEVSSVTENYSVPWDIPTNVIDGKLNTYWHTTITPQAPLPHILTITLPKTEAISGFRYFPRTSGGAGICTKYEIQVSTDGVNYTTVATGNWEDDTFAKDATFKENVAAKYVKFIMLEANGGYGHAAEVRLLKKDSSRPNGPGVDAIDPAVLSDDETSVKGWTFDTSSTNTTSSGTPNEKPENTIDGDLVSHWHSHINPKAEGPHYITAIFPEPTYISGFRYYPRGTGEAGICKKYEIHVSADGVNFQKVSEGTWNYDKKMKESDFLVNVEAKAVKLVILDGQYGFGSAGEIRMIKPKSGYNNVSSADLTKGIDQYKLKPVIFDSMTITTSIDGKTSSMASFITDNERGSVWTSAGKGVLEGKADIAPPIDINYNFGYPYTINGFEYTPRSTTSWHGKGHFKTVEVYESENGTDYTLHETVHIDDDDLEAIKYVFFQNPVKTKYLKLRVVECRGVMAAVADLRFLQSGVQNELDNINDEETYILHIGSKDIKVKKGTEEKTITIDVAPYIYNGSTMIPLRGLLEEMGATIGWNGDNQQISVQSRIGDMLFRIESWNVYIGGKRLSTPVAPQITDSRTFIPLRFVSENLGYNVYWNGETQEIRISNK